MFSTQKSSGLILLDRDGVLNALVIDSEHGTVDSPLNPDQVEVFSWVPQALQRLHNAGFGLAIVSNQPAAAKGKTTQHLLEKVHDRILNEVQSQGGVILSSHLCFHRSEDLCRCRKPKTGLLEEAFLANPQFNRGQSWMVGDGVTDVEAGCAFSLKTAFFGPKKCDHCLVLENKGLAPDFWGKNLAAFADFILNSTGTPR